MAGAKRARTSAGFAVRWLGDLDPDNPVTYAAIS